MYNIGQHHLYIPSMCNFHYSFKYIMIHLSYAQQWYVRFFWPTLSWPHEPQGIDTAVRHSWSPLKIPPPPPICNILWTRTTQKLHSICACDRHYSVKPAFSGTWSLSLSLVKLLNLNPTKHRSSTNTMWQDPVWLCGLTESKPHKSRVAEIMWQCAQKMETNNINLGQNNRV